jgi:hypothetical protein
MSEPQDGPLRADDEPALDETPARSGPECGGPEPETPVTEDEPDPTPSRGACRTELRGWAGAHLHGAVRPRRRAARRGRPPSRWC